MTATPEVCQLCDESKPLTLQFVALGAGAWACGKCVREMGGA